MYKKYGHLLNIPKESSNTLFIVSDLSFTVYRFIFNDKPLIAYFSLSSYIFSICSL